MTRDRVAAYLAKRSVCDAWPVAAEGRYARAVVIPVLAEERNLFDTLSDLAANDSAYLRETVVLCVVNHREDAAEDVVAENGRTVSALHEARYSFDLVVIDAMTEGRALPRKEGVGLARKIGLDHGLRLCPDGLLISLDADTRVEPHYLAAIDAYFREHRSTGAAVVEYAHPLDVDGEFFEAMARYEIFLRYQVLGLSLAGSPYAYHTIGSAMACRSDAYAAAGGMARKQAGEDFYFLQALAKLGPMGYIGETVVRPAARTSWRVPFGTGRALTDAAAGDDRLSSLYAPASYDHIAAFLSMTGAHGAGDGEALLAQVMERQPDFGAYLKQQGFVAAWESIAAQARDDAARLAQFHRWFDAFRTLRALHEMRDNGLPAEPMADAAAAIVERCTGSRPDWTEPDASEAVLRDAVGTLRRLTRERMTR